MRSEVRVLRERYELRQQLGHGAMGEVWLGYDRQSQQAVAVKLIHREFLDSHHMDEQVQRFEREANLLASLRHPGIPTFLDAQLDPGAGTPYLVMEYILGHDLQEILREKRRLSEKQVVPIAIQLCNALEHTHAIPVIHRDLKPANIMLAGGQRVTILDFSVARIFRADHTRLTQGSRVLGTVDYMPPEQFEGRDVTPRSDLYSLACVLYELLTGSPPFAGDSAARVMHAHLNHQPIPISRLRPGVARPLEAVIMAGLAKRAKDRPATAREFRKQLGTQNWELSDSATKESRVSGRGSKFDISWRPTIEPLSTLMWIMEAEKLFNEGQIGRALPIFASLSHVLANLGSHRADDAARCRFMFARCQMHLGYQEEALADLRILSDELQKRRPFDDPLLLDIRFHVGQLRIDLGDQHGIGELAEVYRALMAADGRQDTTLFTEVRRALHRATQG